MSMEEALFLPIRQMNKPQYEITYRGKTYQSKRAFARENNIGIVCIREMMENHGVDFETAADILLEIKEKAGIPAEQMITRFPMCMIRGKEYRTLVELAAELKISAAAISTYKNRNGCGRILETLCQMQKEERETYFLDGRAVSYKELMQMGYTSASYQTVPKRKFRYTHSLQGMILLQAVSMSQEFMRRSSQKDWNRKRDADEHVRQYLFRNEMGAVFFMEKERRQI